MLLVVATLPGKPDAREEFGALLAGLAQVSRDDAGCLSFSFYADLEDPSVFVSIETWQDRASLDAHMEQPHVAAASNRLAELLGGVPTIVAHEVVASVKVL